MIKVICKKAFGSLLIVSLLFSISGCQRTESEQTIQATIHPLPHSERRLYIYSASSLERFVSSISTRYRHQYPEVELIVSLVGSQTARLQLERGAPPGIFLSADQRHIERLAEQGKIWTCGYFAENRMSLITQKSSAISSIDELLNGQGFAIGVDQVPVGRYAWSLLKRYYRGNDQALALLSQRIKTQEISARALKARLRRKEVESAFIYQSDLGELNDVREVKLPHTLSELARVKLMISVTRSMEGVPPPDRSLDWFRLALDEHGKEAIREVGLRPITEHNENQHPHSQYCGAPQILK